MRVRHSYYVGFGAGTESSIYIVAGWFSGLPDHLVVISSFWQILGRLSYGKHLFDGKIGFQKSSNQAHFFLTRVLTNQSGTALGVSFRESELRDSDAKCITRFLFPKGRCCPICPEPDQNLPPAAYDVGRTSSRTRGDTCGTIWLPNSSRDTLVH